MTADFAILFLSTVSLYILYNIMLYIFIIFGTYKNGKTGDWIKVKKKVRAIHTHTHRTEWVDFIFIWLKDST